MHPLSHRLFLCAAFCSANIILSPLLHAQDTKTIHNMRCTVTIPGDWIQKGAASAHAPGDHSITAFVRLSMKDDPAMLAASVKNGSMSGVKAKIVDDNSKRIIVSSQPAGLRGKSTNRLHLITKSDPACQARVDFDDPSDAATARKILDTTTGAQ